MKVKKTFSLLLLAILCTVSFTACSNSDGKDSEDNFIWNFPPIMLNISVQDANCNDLLNPNTLGNIVKQGIKAVNRAITYVKNAPVPQTKMINTPFTGLQTAKLESGKYVLTFGSFSATNAYQDERVLIDWNDETTDIINFSSTLT